jgi:hypothetical protein
VQKASYLTTVLTVFSVAKPFRGKFATIQRNAILSWAQLQPKCQLLLFGNEEGIAEVAAETGATHLPTLERNEFGTPLVNNIFSQAQKHARFDRLCYVNADILLLSDFLPSIQRISDWNPRSLVVGHRWDLDVSDPLVWDNGWEASLRSRVVTEAKLHPYSGIDYFVFPRGLWGSIPPFATGHCGFWDNWLIFRARQLGIPVVDATACLTVVHQNHPNSYHAGGQANACWNTETERNYELGGGLKNACTLRDATHRLVPSGISRRVVPFDWHRCLVSPFVKQKWARPFVRLKKALAEAMRIQASKEAP